MYLYVYVYIYLYVSVGFGFWCGFDYVSVSGSTSTYGFRGAVTTGTGKYNLYMDGTASNYFAGSTGIGTSSSSAMVLSNMFTISLATGPLI